MKILNFSGPVKKFYTFGGAVINALIKWFRMYQP
jgi:hypothetical protein